MIRKLRKRLTIIFTAITSLILLAVLGVTLWYNIAQMEQNYIREFNSNVNYIAMSLASEEKDNSWMTEIEEKNHIIISAEKDGEEVGFKPGWGSGEKREIAIEKAKEALSENTVVQTATYASVASAFSGFPSDTYKTYTIRVANKDGEENEEIDISYIFSDGHIEEYIVESVDNNGDKRQQTMMPVEEWDAIQGEVIEIELEESDDESRMAAETVVAKAVPAYSLSLEVAETIESAQALPIEDITEADLFLGSALMTTTYDTFVDIKTDSNDKYRMQSLSYIQSSNEYNMIILDDMKKETNDKLFTVLGYAGLFLLGTVLLVVVNWFLSKLIVKPTEEGLKKQAEFVAAASHELRNPLAVIKGSLEAAQICDNAEDVDKYYANVSSEADQMSRLVNDLLLLAGNDSKRWSLLKEPFDLDTMLIELSEQYTPVARKNGKELHLDLPDEALGEIEGDSMRIRQIISVFIDNAISHSHDETEIILKAKRKKKKIYISVVDHGDGISSEDKERIFDRFFQADNSRNSKKHFGLGLSIAKDLAKLHGGSVSVTDTEGGGSTFTLTLPEKS